MAADVVDYSIVSALAVLVACGELLTRYRDAPIRALTNWSAFAYALVNVAGAVSALALIRVFDVNFDLSGEKLRWTQVLVAGFGAMAVFRTSLFIARVGGQDIGMGPSGVLQAMLNVADRGVDRHGAKYRANSIAKTMDGVSFDKAQIALPAHCFALMQNVSAEEQAAVADQIVGKLKAADMSDSTKALALGLALMNVVGDEVLLAAVASLGNEIKRLEPSP